jgi:flagellar hook-basal body complex protein FliE
MTKMPDISALKATIKTENHATNIPFADVFQNVFTDFQETQRVSNEDAYKLAMGNLDDLHSVMINSEKATAALELTVQLTSKAVNAYKEIMQMQI